MTAHYTLPASWEREILEADARRAAQPKTPDEIWSESPHVTAWRRNVEIARLQESGVVIGGLA